MKKRLVKIDKWCQEKCDEMGVDYFPINWEVVPEDVMLEVMSYGLPTRARHWSYGQSYKYQKLNGEMGMSKVYELILNNNPSYAFLLDTNPDIAQIMVIAHCVHEGTKVITLDGVKPISEVIKGDKVFTHKGRISTVNWCKETARKNEITELKVRGSDEVYRFTSDHKIYVETSIGPSWVKVSEIKEDDRIIYPKEIQNEESSLEEVMIKIESIQSNDRLFRKKAFNERSGYTLKLNEESGRMIGLYIAEGYLSGTQVHFAMHKDEDDYHAAISSAISNLSPELPVHVSKRERDNSGVVHFSDKWIGKWLEESCGKGCENKKVPDFVFTENVPAEFKRGIIRGLFEGDGYFDNENRSSSFSTTSELLANQLKFLLNSFGIFSSISSRNRKSFDIKGERKTSYELVLSGEDNLELYNIVEYETEYNPSRSWSFSKKKDDYITGQIEWVRSFSTEEAQSFWDMEVEEDHSFALYGGIIAHNCYGHSAFFKNNYLFKQTDRQMVYHAAERAARIEGYIEKYGIDKVEYMMDIGLAFEKNIDWHKGLFREPYPGKKKIIKTRLMGEFEDLLGISEPEKKEVVINSQFPPAKEYDINWFLVNYSPKLEEWQKDILTIIREESFYFYPQYMTKIMNEGFASYIHAELMYMMGEDILSSSEYIEFVKIHERVVQPGANSFNINPYFLGFTIFNNIKKKWDKLYEEGKSKITGFQKMLEVVEEEDDISFLRTYLTQDIVDDLKMFTYVNVRDARNNEYIKVKSKKVKDIVEAQISKMFNYRVPLIAVTKASSNGIELEHDSPEVGTVSYKDLPKVMSYLYDAWGDVVDIKTWDLQGKAYHFTFDEEGFSDTDENGNMLITKRKKKK